MTCARPHRPPEPPSRPPSPRGPRPRTPLRPRFVRHYPQRSPPRRGPELQRQPPRIGNVRFNIRTLLPQSQSGLERGQARAKPTDNDLGAGTGLFKVTQLVAGVDRSGDNCPLRCSCRAAPWPNKCPWLSSPSSADHDPQVVVGSFLGTSGKTVGRLATARVNMRCCNQ